MYGKIYPSCYTGSLYGAGAMVFALWPYVIANARIDDGGQVELNPKMLSGILGEPIQKIEEAIEFLCRPDPESRAKAEDGRRIIKVGSFAYRVVNLEFYRDGASDDARRQYWKEYKRKKRRNSPKEPENPKEIQTCPTLSTPVHMEFHHADADADADADAGGRVPPAHAPPKNTRERKADVTDVTPVTPVTSVTVTQADIENGSEHLYDGQIPTLAEVLAIAQMKCVPEKSARSFFNHHEDGNLWVNQLGKLINWRSKLVTWATNDRQFGKSGGNKAFPETKLKAIQNEIDSHPANKESAHYKSAHTEAQKKDLRELRKKLQQVNSEIARA